MLDLNIDKDTKVILHYSFLYSSDYRVISRLEDSLEEVIKFSEENEDMAICFVETDDEILYAVSLDMLAVNDKNEQIVKELVSGATEYKYKQKKYLDIEDDFYFYYSKEAEQI